MTITACSDGLAQAGGRILWFHTNPLGTPEALADQDGTLVWDGLTQNRQYRAWGELDAAQGGEHQPLRFPGQYHDSESGLHYNTFRYYDPEAGRYLSPDPIGLAGGLNLYSYVPDPNSWMDPWGWCAKVLGKNMKTAGIPRAKNTTPHHLAGDTSKRSLPARKILSKHGIGVDDAENGVFLPHRGNKDPNVPGILHDGRHPNKYIDAVNRRISDADIAGGKPSVLKELDAIRQELLQANRNAKWKDVL